MKPGQGSRLDSWKEIAKYVGRNERTVMRWADERGFPMHRVPGGNRPTVFALTAEIDAWMLGQKDTWSGDAAHPANENSEPARVENDRLVTDDSPKTPKFIRTLGRAKWIISASVVVAVVVGASAFWLTRAARGSAPRIDSVTLDVDTLEAKDRNGRTLWSHRYQRPFERRDLLQMPIGMHPTRIADFFGDGHQEVAAGIALNSGPNRSDPATTELSFFSEDGKELWSYAPTLTLKFGEHELKPPWVIEDIFATTIEKQSKLYAIGAHHTWGNSFIAEIDPRTGKDSIRYVNTGALYSLSEVQTSSGTFLLAGGFNNEWDGASLAIFNINKGFVASPQTTGTRHKCESCPAGDPDYYFVFPRSELNRRSDAYNMPIFTILVLEDGIQVDKDDRLGSGKEATFYLLDREPPFRLKWMRFETNYQLLHRKWSEEGKLDHKYEDCPELKHPKPVKMWTPSSGWTTIEVPGTKEN